MNCARISTSVHKRASFFAEPVSKNKVSLFLSRERQSAHIWQVRIGLRSVLAQRYTSIRKVPRAFSSEVDTGSREENASNKELKPPFRFHRNGKGSSVVTMFERFRP
jgi:hypothetical protein